MRVFVILSCAVMMANAGGMMRWPQKRVFKTYGSDVVRDGFCPREPREPNLCDFNTCNKDNHCVKPKKCCPGKCGALMCLDAVPGERRTGECPKFWNVAVPPINECEIDAECKNDSHKCCRTDTFAIRKCVLPKANISATPISEVEEFVGPDL